MQEPEALLFNIEPAVFAVELEFVQVVAHLVQEPEVLELVVKPSLMLFIKSPPWWMLVQPVVLEVE